MRQVEHGTLNYPSEICLRNKQLVIMQCNVNAAMLKNLCVISLSARFLNGNVSYRSLSFLRNKIVLLGNVSCNAR